LVGVAFSLLNKGGTFFRKKRKSFSRDEERKIQVTDMQSLGGEGRKGTDQLKKEDAEEGRCVVTTYPPRGIERSNNKEDTS